MRKVLYCILFFLSVIFTNVSSQDIPNVFPVSPKAFEFLKYLDTPVSEYTGIPNIKVPIYEINHGEISIPIQLSYHGGGIRVNEEASWVGLGWSMNFGGITQVINDRDDLDDTYERILPDYHFKIPPYDFVFRYNPLWYISSKVPDEYIPSIGINQKSPKHSFVRYTNYFIPVDKSYNKRYPYLLNGSGWSADDVVDSEPDIFKVNLLNHSFSFIFDFKTNQIIVLSKKGYKVELAGNKRNWTITDPSGIKYFLNDYEETVTTQCETVSSVRGNLGGKKGLVSGRFVVQTGQSFVFYADYRKKGQ